MSRRLIVGRLASAALIVAALAILVLVPNKAQAQTVGLHLVTAHFANTSETPLRSVTPGLYVRFDSGATLGVYRNSDGATSAYAAFTVQTADERYALTGGVVTGYAASKVMPLLVPSVRFRITECDAVRVAFIPKPIKHGHAAGLHLSVERSF
jgi:hypothetical protein